MAGAVGGRTRHDLEADNGHDSWKGRNRETKEGLDPVFLCRFIRAEARSEDVGHDIGLFDVPNLRSVFLRTTVFRPSRRQAVLLVDYVPNCQSI
jgi:hypothetical protein